MAYREPDPATIMRRLVEGYQVSQAIHVAATLGIADLLADENRTSDELAESTGTHPPALYRLLRALASVDVLYELDGRCFGLAPLGECLRSDVPDSIASWAAFVGRPYYWQAWAGLSHSIRTGEKPASFLAQGLVSLPIEFDADGVGTLALDDRAHQSGGFTRHVCGADENELSSLHLDPVNVGLGVDDEPLSRNPSATSGAIQRHEASGTPVGCRATGPGFPRRSAACSGPP